MTKIHVNVFMHRFTLKASATIDANMSGYDAC